MNKTLGTLFLLGLRGTGLLSKFALTLFIARDMTLAELGLFGLITVGATLVPATLGLGLNGPIGRQLVDLPTAAALSLASTRLSVTVLLHLLLTPLSLLVISAFLPPEQLPLLWLVAATLVLEHLSSDLNSILLARFRPNMAAVFLFIRSGAWPLLFVALAWFYPGLRSVPVIMMFWLGSLLLIGATILIWLGIKGYWPLLRPDFSRIRAMIRQSRHLYLADIGNNCALYLDRFLVTSFLGLEAAGIYTFFWSLTSAVNNIIFYGVTSPRAPTIIAAVNLGNKAAMVQACKSMLKEIWLWCLGLSLLLVCAMPTLLAAIGNTRFEQHENVFIIMLLATLLRTVSEGAGNILYAHHQDHKIAMISLSAMVISALCILSLAPLFDLQGAAIAMLLAAIFVYLWRNRITRGLLA